MDNLGSNTSLGELSGGLQHGILNDKETQLAIAILEAGFSNLFVLVGLLGNALTVIVFYKMGYKETINISLTFLCSLDFMRCLFVLMFCLQYPLRLFSLLLAAKWEGIGRVTLNFLSITIVFTSGVLAAYVSLERCLCVSIPFSVKYLLTPRVVWVNNFLISLIVLSSMLLYYTCYTYHWIFDPALNASIPVQGFRPFFYKHPEVDVYMTVMVTGWVILSFFVICICTIIISYHLRKASKFKASATHAQQKGNDSQLSARDRQVIKMLLVIIAVYIGVIIPKMLTILIRIIFPEVDLDGKERNLLHVISICIYTADHLNSAVNIFIIYFMSSQFKKTLNVMFRSSKSHSSSDKTLALEQ